MALVVLMALPVYGRVPLQLDSPVVILVEQTTGRVLYSRSERVNRYPADISVLLTALVAVEYLELDEVLVVGTEIRGMPTGYGPNIHFEGETITVDTLLHALLVRAGNDTGRVLALNVVRRIDGRFNIPYEQARHTFAVMMNEKARSLGTRNTHFDNPYGRHSVNHFTTAYDMAIITRAFMENPILAEIAGTRIFEADSLNGVEHHAPNVRQYSWTNNNLMLPHAPHGHPYIIGAKAGNSATAGHTLAAAAYNDGMQFVTVVMGGTDAERWQDTRRLMDYGFSNFRFREVSRENEVIKTVRIENPRRGDSSYLTVLSSRDYTTLLSNSEYSAINRTITFDPLLYVVMDDEAYTIPTLRAPITYGARIGMATYTSNGQVIFEAPVISSRAVEEHSFDSDMDYYIAFIFSNIFTRRALPIWFGLFGMGVGIFGIYFGATANRRAEDRRSNRYSRF